MFCGKRITPSFWVCKDCELDYSLDGIKFKDWPVWAKLAKRLFESERRGEIKRLVHELDTSVEDILESIEQGVMLEGQSTDKLAPFIERFSSYITGDTYKTRIDRDVEYSLEDDNELLEIEDEDLRERLRYAKELALDDGFLYEQEDEDD